jgi:hypothetical protein
MTAQRFVRVLAIVGSAALASNAWAQGSGGPISDRLSPQGSDPRLYPRVPIVPPAVARGAFTGSGGGIAALATDSGELAGGIALGAFARAVEEEGRAHYGLEGAVIGGLTTGMLVALFGCPEECGAPGRLILAATGALPGMVIGGLLGSFVEKKRKKVPERQGDTSATLPAPQSSHPAPPP